MSSVKNTALFFGSFNPIHIGHLVIANYMVEFEDIAELWFVVSPQNPLKNEHDLLAAHHRYAMVSIAVENDLRFRASNIEFSLPKPSFTIDTLRVLTEKYPKRRFSIIMGSDNLMKITKWKEYQTILSDYQIYIYPRQGFISDEFISHPSVKLVTAPLMDISSTFIRNALARKKDVRYFLPENVYKYIDEMHFYKVADNSEHNI